MNIILLYLHTTININVQRKGCNQKDYFVFFF